MSTFNARQGISVGSPAVNVVDASGNVTATTFTGPGTGLTNIPITALATTGAASSTTYLNGAGAYTTPTTSMPSAGSFASMAVSGGTTAGSYYLNGVGTVNVVGGSGMTGNLIGSSRGSGGVYTNSTGRVLVVYVSADNGQSNGYIIVYLGGVTVGKINTYGQPSFQCILVPPGYTYGFTNSSATLNGWYEY